VVWTRASLYVDGLEEELLRVGCCGALNMPPEGGEGWQRLGVAALVEVANLGRSKMCSSFV